MLIRKTVPNFVNGVSQQPVELRLPSQADAQENCLSNLVRGLQRRPPAEHIAKIASVTTPEQFARYLQAKSHVIDRDNAERYEVVITNGSLEVYNLFTGAQVPVSFPDGMSYLTASNPRDDFRTFTAADFTFITNRNKVVHMSDARTPVLPRTALVFIKASHYSEEYTVSITYNGVTASWSIKCPDMQPTSNADTVRQWLNTSTIATRFAAYISTGATGGSYTYSSTGGTSATTMGLLVSSEGPLIKITNEAPLGGHIVAHNNSSTSSSGTVSASTSYMWQGQSGTWYTQSADLAVDTSASTYWSANTSTLPQWLRYQFSGGAKTVGAYRLNSRGRGGLRSWTLQGSTNGSTWTTVDTRQGVTLPTQGEVFYLTEPATYAYYRINITAIQEPLDWAVIYDFQLYPPQTQGLDTPGPDFSIKVTDAYAGDHAVGLKGEVQKFTDLPKKGWPGFKIKVQGDPEDDSLAYWVEYRTESEIGGLATTTGGAWHEVPAPLTLTSFEPTSMPHVLTNNGDGTFTFRAANWDHRNAGDEDSIPPPSFVDQTISDVFYVRGRLGLLTNENIVTSRSGDQTFNFWRKKASQVLDTDPIDIGVTVDEVSVLNSAVTFDGDLLVFSSKGQLKLTSGGQALAPTTAELLPAASYPNAPQCKPVSTGTSVYFAVDRDGYTGVMEYALTEQQFADGMDRTEHVPRFIPGVAYRLTASKTENMLAAITPEDDNAVYVYSYRDGEQRQRVQASWSRWSFGLDDVVVDCAFLNTDLYLLILRPDGLYIEIIRCASDRHDDGSNFTIHADRRIAGSAVTSVFSGGNTTFTLPYPVATTQTVLIVPRAGVEQELPTPLAVTRVSPTQFRVVGDHRATPLFIGLDYTSIFVPSQVIHRDQNQEGNATPDAQGRLQIRRFFPVIGKRSVTDVEVLTRSRTVPRLLADRVHSNDLAVSYPSPTGRFQRYRLMRSAALHKKPLQFPCPGENSDVVVRFRSVGPYPFALIGGAWECFYVNRARTV